MHRTRFPGLADGWARLDGPAGTQMVDDAIEAMAAWMRSGHTANQGGAFRAAEETDALVAQARASVGALLGASAEGIVFGPSMTALTMRFSAAVGRALQPGDELVCTRLDHDANVAPWLIAAARAGAQVRFAEPDRDTLELPAAAAAGARVFVDAVHATPHREIDVGALDCDALACSAYKWFGPHIGILWARPELLAELQPDKLRPSPDTAPDRWELGTLPFESLAGVRAAAEFMLGLDRAALRAHEDALLAAMLDGLGAIDGVTLHGAARDRTPTIMFSVRGRDAEDVARALAAEEVAVWHGNYYALELARHLGLEHGGAVRAGAVAYTSDEDVRRLVDAVPRL